MNEILFLLFAFFTVFLSIKLSYYVDYISKSSKISGAFLGGIVLAGVTSLPEFVTCFSAVFVENNLLAVGDILGSNIFNVFMISFFDLVFIKKMIFSETNKTHNLIFLLLIVNYIVIFCFSSFSFSFIGIPTFLIFVVYGYYLLNVYFRKEETVKINDNSCDNAVLKLIVTALLMIFSSVILTIIVNKLAILHPYFSSSFLGAIFLGITTSLPEVITCYTLISIDNYDLALDDIIGSNFFNLLILAIADLFVVNKSIYSSYDSDVLVLVVLGLLFTILCFVNNIINKRYSSRFYGLISFIIVIMYLGYWIINFLG